MLKLPTSRLRWAFLPLQAVGPVEAQLVCYEGFGDYAAAAPVENGSNTTSGTNPRVGIGANTTSDSFFPADFQFFARGTTEVSASAFFETLPIAAATTYLLRRPHPAERRGL